MGGALLELIAKGNQDVYLIGNPNMTYFKNVYNRHTNFSMETIETNFNDVVDFGKKVTALIEKKGDLLHKMFLEINLPTMSTGATQISWINGIGNQMIDFVELYIGGVLIDRVRGDVMDVWSELTTPIGQQSGYYKMVGKFTSFNKATQQNSLTLFIPLPFWFCNDISRSLPLVSLQYSDIKVSVQFKNFNQLWFNGNNTGVPAPDTKSITKANLLCDYIFLDEFERKKFAGMKKTEYLIEQYQIITGNHNLANQSSINIPLFLNHPVKELIWFYHSDERISYNDLGDYSSGLSNIYKKNPITNVELKFNGQDRFKKRNAEFFRLVQPYKHHTRSPVDYIYCYSFAITPEYLQPSGSCNFSKIDNANLLLELQSTMGSGEFIVFAINYNILEIKNGMAGLLFSS